VKSSNQVALGVLIFRGRIGIGSDHDSEDARRWSQAVAELGDKAVALAAGGAVVAGRFGAETLDRATAVFRPVDSDGDGIPDKAKATAAAENAVAAIKGAASGAADALGSMLRPKTDKSASFEQLRPDQAADD
jgi:hypothetical protein